MTEYMIIHNRPAWVEAKYETVARVRWDDNGLIGYVDIDDVCD